MLKDPASGVVGERRRIGGLLLEAGLVTEDQLRDAMEEQKKHGGRLCYNLIRQGSIGADDLLLFLREQFGVAAVNLDHFSIEPAVLDLLPGEFVRSRRVIPLHLLEETLTVAMADPWHREVIEELQEVTGMKIDPLIAPEATLANAIARYYPPGRPGEGLDAEEGVLTLGDEAEEQRLHQSGPLREECSGEEWLKRFVLQAIKRRSRQVHLEPVEHGLQVRFRVGKKLYEGETLPPVVGREIVSRALALAGIDLQASATSPMEGRLRIAVRQRKLRATLSSFPTLHGERLVLQILDEALRERDFQELGMSREVADEVSRILRMRNGLLLVNAPPNQGKKATFYSLLSYLKGEGGRNIMTLEYPLQYPLAGVSQTQVSFVRGVDFYYGLKSLLRQNPDVAGLTDINDCRTLELVFTAARQCLVVGLCSFWDNLQVLEWIASCGIAAAVQSHLLRGLLVQRLLPRICSHCRVSLEAPVNLVEGVRDRKPEELTFYSGEGCERCGQTGREGRLGIFELLSLRSTLKELLAGGTEVRILHDEAQRQGMRTLQEDGLVKASQGLVDVRDVLEATREGRGED